MSQECWCCECAADWQLCLVCSLKHGPKKADYVDDVFNVINWRQVRFETQLCHTCYLTGLLVSLECW